MEDFRAGAEEMRYAAKSDISQPKIVEDLRKAGYSVWNIKLPDDLLVWHPKFGANNFRMLSVKTADAKGRVKERGDRKKQNAFCALTGVPRVSNSEQALEAMES